MYNIENINALKNELVDRVQTIAVAESVTSGHIQAALSLATNASKFFQGGITTYNIGQKCRHLNVDPIHAQACNCVSAKVAEEMAIHVSKLFISHWGVGITGYATPIPELGIKDLFAFYSIAYKGSIISTQRIITTENDPLKVQVYFANQVIKGLADFVK